MENWFCKKYKIEVFYDENVINLNSYGHIYLFTNNTNNKKYVGQTINFKKRIPQHFDETIDNKIHPLNNALRKYGFNGFTCNIIDNAIDGNVLNEKEIYYIKLYNTTDRNYGYNIEAGGVNALASPETKLKLSLMRRGRKQSQEWVDRRIDAIAKPVIKIDRKTNTILEKFRSLADAGRYNKDNLSYEAIGRLCLGSSKNNKDFMYYYEEDFLNNSLPEFNKKVVNEFSSLSKDQLNEICHKFKDENVSVRQLSEDYSINFSTLNKYLTDLDKPDLIFKPNVEYVAICKKTGKTFADYLNKSGALTNSIIENHPEFKIESKFKRKQIELKTGKPWYYEFFEFKSK